MSLLNAHLGGSDDDSDEEDDDYNPNADKTAEREDMPQGAAPAKRQGKRRRGAALPSSAPEVGDDDDEDGGADEDEDEDDDADAGPQEPGRVDPRAEERREKIANLWEAINMRAAANGTGSERLPSSSVTLATFCKSARSRAEIAARAKGQGAGPAEALTLGQAAGQAKAAGGGKGPAAKKARKESDLVWMRSLGLLKPSAAAAEAPAGPSSDAGGAGGSGSGDASASGGAATSATDEEKRALAAAAIAAARDASGVGSRAGKVAITETRRFAGKDIQVTVMVDRDSKEAQKAAARASAPVAPSSGLDALLAEVEKKKKVSVLDKTKADWSTYKRAHMDVDEELEMHKKGADQYLDKQNFLKRAELREYEKERDARLASDVRTRGRL
ncbi:hypothetical protein HYH03_018099 [Edaphochlamys debaryana]|uniref:BCNT-C domain-containing protein n=1 Tax=Edaphochlamys debaryana TaxID=47281 RepID=A0A835XMT2_9CHLO|nr:hypothetical protein HYH03_018099 [Edaphochlamys debaryana]|eukprot:KAG2483019.1 hypothetical protein HYH03_018099 [Edaphochlamys debaryana]